MPAPSVESVFRQKVAAVVGFSRVYPDQVPQSQTLWPCIVYQLVGGDEGQSLSDTGRSRLRFARFNTEVWSPDDKVPGARGAARAVREKLFDEFAGANCRGDWFGLFVTGAMASDPSADTEPIDTASENMDRIERLTVEVHYRKPAE